VIDRRVGLLLETLRAGGAVALVEAVANRLSAMEPDDRPADDMVDRDIDEDRDDAGIDDGGPDDQYPLLEAAIALRQLSAADAAVLSYLRIEKDLIEAIPIELRNLREAQAGRGGESGFLVKEVTILPHDDDVSEYDGGGERIVGERGIADEEALSAIVDLREAWQMASERTRMAIDDGR